MNNKLPCELIRDLFPSYIDKLTSDTTNTIVENHFTECDECRYVLESMKEPSTEPVSSNEITEIDFLKKHRNNNRKIIIGSIISSIMLIALVLFLRIFLIGNNVSVDMVNCNLKVLGNELYLQSSLKDSDLGIASINYREDNRILTISMKAAKKSPFNKNEVVSEYISKNDIDEIYLDDRIIWSYGNDISAMASAVYNTRHEFIGNMSQNIESATALNITKYLGTFTNELQTSTKPYGWKIILDDDIPANQQHDKETAMKAYAYVLIGIINNLREVTFEYTVDGENHTLTRDYKDATQYFGQDIKNCYQFAWATQRLITLTEIEQLPYMDENTQADASQSIKLLIDCDTPIKSLSVTYLVDGEACTTQVCENADGSPIESGDSMQFEFTRNDFGDIDLEKKSDIWMEILVHDTYGKTHKVKGLRHAATEFGFTYEYWINNNGANGYQIEH